MKTLALRRTEGGYASYAGHFRGRGGHETGHFCRSEAVPAQLKVWRVRLGRTLPVTTPRRERVAEIGVREQQLPPCSATSRLANEFGSERRELLLPHSKKSLRGTCQDHGQQHTVASVARVQKPILRNGQMGGVRGAFAARFGPGIPALIAFKRCHWPRTVLAFILWGVHPANSIV
jgi:hypothetical protein